MRKIISLCKRSKIFDYRPFLFDEDGINNKKVIIFLNCISNFFSQIIIMGAELKHLIIESTVKTPQIDLNHLSGDLILAGRSIPENPAKIYEIVLQWVNQYVQKPRQTTNLRLNLEYFNTASVIWLGKIVKALCAMKEPENTLIIHLYFDIEEFDSMEADDIKDALSPVLDMIGTPVISLGIKIYGTDDKGEILKESMVLI